MKFQTAKHIHLLKPMSNKKFENFKIQVHRHRSTRKFTKISITFYSSSQNSVKSAYNRLPAKPLKYSNFYDIFADVWPILMKFCMMTHISYPVHNSCSKSQIYKNSRCWTLAFRKKWQMQYLKIVCLILIEFGIEMHNSHHNVNSRSVH